jgi:hypothetical protein
MLVSEFALILKSVRETIRGTTPKKPAEWAFFPLAHAERIKSSLMLSVMQASNSYRGFESLLLRHAVCELFLQGISPGESPRATGKCLFETDPEQRNFRAEFRPSGLFPPAFLQGMIV